MTPSAVLTSTTPAAPAPVAERLPVADLSVAVLRRQLLDLAQAAHASLIAHDAFLARHGLHGPALPDPMGPLREELAALNYPPDGETTDLTSPATEGR